MTFGEWAERYRMNRPGIEALARTGHAMDAEVPRSPKPPADRHPGICAVCELIDPRLAFHEVTFEVPYIADVRIGGRLCHVHFAKLVSSALRRG
jgi:hypothetical protein